MPERTVSPRRTRKAQRKRNVFANGFLRAFDMLGGRHVRNPYARYRSPHEADRVAFMRDWQDVGADYGEAIGSALSQHGR